MIMFLSNIGKILINTCSLLFIVLWLLCSEALALPVSEIIFEGNKVTKEKVLRQELLLHEGDEADTRRIEDSRQAMMNLKLFKSVRSRLEEAGTSQRLIFTVEERYFILPIPLLGGNTEDKSYNYGLELRHDNVFGLNHRLKVSYENKKIIDSPTPEEKKSSIKYSNPRLIDSPFAISLNGKHSSKYITETDITGTINTGSYLQQTNSGGFFVSRWMEPNWISQGWRVGMGLSASEKSYHQQLGSALIYSDSQSLAISAGLNYNQVDEYPYHRSGTRYGYSISVAQPGLGSDYDFTRHQLDYQRYQPLKALDANINSQFQLKLSNGRSFNSATYSIGNSALLRGYENDYREGEAMMLLNLEYHHHISGYRQLRGVMFADAGNAWASPIDIDLSDMLVGLGVGLRWRVQSFVDLTLRVDYARALQYDNETLSLTTSASF